MEDLQVSTSKTQHHNNIKKSWINNTYWTLLFILLGFIKLSILDITTVQSGSMNPNIDYPSKQVLYRSAYGFKIPWTNLRLFCKDPQRGDMIVFQSPIDLENTFLKRIIGIPGDTITFQNHLLYINGKNVSSPVSENFVYAYNNQFANKLSDYTYLLQEKTTNSKSYITQYVPNYELPNALKSFTITVPKDCYFVLGDNRSVSIDSRVWGYVHRDQIIGKNLENIIGFSKSRIKSMSKNHDI